MNQLLAPNSSDVSCCTKVTTVSSDRILKLLGGPMSMNQSSLENAELGTSGKSLMNTQNEEKLKV